MLILKIAVWVLAICASGIAYRAGGMGKEDTTKPTWIPKGLRKSWVRDWLCPLFLLLALLTLWQPSSLLGLAMLLPYYGLSGGALSTYLDSIFGYDNYFAHGFLCGIAALPLIVFVPWWILVARIVICTLGMGLWSAKEDIDWKEEMGRGIFFVL